MLSRTRNLVAVTLLVGCLAAPAAWAQAQNLEAGKSASQLFAGTCNACHKSPRGLLKTVSAGALPGFLREHYTTSGDMASQLSSFLISNGASDTRQVKQGAGAADQTDHQGRKMRNAPSQEAARPETDAPAAESGRQGRRRLAHPADPSDPVANVPAAVERGPDGRRLSAKQRLSRPGRPGVEEPPMTKDESTKTESGPDDKPKGEGPKEEIGNANAESNEAKSNEAKPMEAKPADAKSAAPIEAKSTAPKSESSHMETPKDGAAGDNTVVRRDPMPSVTPPPPVAAVPAPAMASGGSSEPATPRLSAPASPAPPEVTASAPPRPAAAGPPAPPISR